MALPVTYAPTPDEFMALAYSAAGTIRFNREGWHDAASHAVEKLWPLVESGRAKSRSVAFAWCRNKALNFADKESYRCHASITDAISYDHPSDSIWSLMEFAWSIDPVAASIMAMVDYGEEFKVAEPKVLGMFWTDQARSRCRIKSVVELWEAS